MAIYIGPRPILPQQNTTEYSNPNKNYLGVAKGVGKYSYWGLFGSTHLLDGAPLHDHAPGDGYHPHNFTLSRWFRGLEPAGEPTKDPGKGTRQYLGRYRPFEYKGLDARLANAGHHIRYNRFTYSLWSNWINDNDPTDDALYTPGHHRRAIGATGTANTFGAFDPLNYGARAVSPTALEGGGQAVPAGYDHLYGRNRVQEWRGVSKAIF